MSLLVDGKWGVDLHFFENLMATVDGDSDHMSVYGYSYSWAGA